VAVLFILRILSEIDLSSYHFVTDFIGRPFREDALAASVSGQRLQYQTGWQFQPIESIRNLTGH
jgi:hypothetical protein